MEYLEDYEDDRTEEIIRYTWNKARYIVKKRKRVKLVPRNEVQVQIDNDTFQYGHEYVGLNPIFQVPLLKTPGKHSNFVDTLSSSVQFSCLFFLFKIF